MLTNQLTGEQYDQMALDVSEASESLWDSNIEDTQEAVTLDKLWIILDKYLKPKDNGNRKGTTTEDTKEKVIPPDAGDI